jgi:hypothetical protein
MGIALLDTESTIDDVNFRSCAHFPEYFHVVSSIHPEHMESCPTSFRKAKQDPVHRVQWRESLFGHLASCYCDVDLRMPDDPATWCEDSPCGYGTQLSTHVAQTSRCSKDMFMRTRISTDSGLKL